MNKNIMMIIVSIIISLLIGMFNIELIFNDNKTMIQTLLSILGLALTSYTFVLVPIQNIVDDNKEKNALVNRLLKEYKDNMQFIFFSCIFLIAVDLIYKINFPFISDPLNIDFGLFKIYSLKTFLRITIEDFLCIISLYSFYDIIKSIFILVSNSFINKK